jgi:hypothetical protein
MYSATRPRTRRNDGAAAAACAAGYDSGPLRSSHCHCRQCQKGHGAPFRTRARVAAADFRFLAGEGVCLVLRVDTGHAPRLLQSVRRAGVGEIRGRLTQRTDRPRAVAIYGAALATLDDDPGLHPTRTRLTSTRRRGSRSPTTSPIPSAYPRPDRTTQFLTGRSPRSR